MITFISYEMIASQKYIKKYNVNELTLFRHIIIIIYRIYLY